MNQNDNYKQFMNAGDYEYDEDTFNLDDLESKLEADLEEKMGELKGIEESKAKIGDPESIGETVINTVWEQFVIQVGTVAGEDFVKENRGMRLDLSDDAHILTTENFSKNDMPSHNPHNTEYQERYNQMQSKFQHDENGNVTTHSTRGGNSDATLAEGARSAYDKGRPKGSVEKGTDFDHTISAGEIMRDYGANAHLTEEERIAFANSDANLNEIDSSHNRSKGDKSMTEWLDNPNSKGQKPEEIFDNLDEERKQRYREKDAEARAEYEKLKAEGEQRSLEEGRQSQKEEALRAGKTGLRAVIMSLLASLAKEVIQKLVGWFKSGNKRFSSFIDEMKEAFKSFWHNLKSHLKSAMDSAFTTILTAIFGPIVSLFKKTWTILKEGYKSIKKAIAYIRAPENRGKDIGILLLEVSKIILAGLSAIGALVIGEAISIGLKSIPGFAIEIPFLGSLSSIIGMFGGALISGVIGALGLRLIDKIIAKRMRALADIERIKKGNEIMEIQRKLVTIKDTKLQMDKQDIALEIINRHQEASEEFNKNYNEIMNYNSSEVKVDKTSNTETIDDIFANLNKI